jgi:hypothetical protein
MDNKFEVRSRTQRPKADGRGFVDDFDVEVRNKLLDCTSSVAELSGGQLVLVNEALNLGIAISNAPKGEGVHYEMLFREETIGALDSRNGVEYARTLRRAIEIGEFHQVVFMSHNPGRLEVGGPGFGGEGWNGQIGSGRLRPGGAVIFGKRGSSLHDSDKVSQQTVAGSREIWF